MKLTRFSIDHAVAVYVLIVCIIIGGLLSYRSLPREAAPDIAIPIVMVSTPYFGVSPADIETLVTKPMERQFRNLRDLKEMTSTSAESASLIVLEFDPEVDIDEVLQRIRVEVDKAKPDLPPDAEDTEVVEINSSDWPILVANVAGDMDPVRLKALAEDMQEDLEALPGVLRVSLAGGVEREIHILLNPDRMRQLGVSADDVINAMRSENVNLPGGSIDIGAMKYTVRVAGEFEELESMRHIVIKSPEGNPIYLRDIAEIEDGFEDPTTFSRLTTWQENAAGERVPVTKTNVSLAIVKRSGENIVAIAQDAKKVIDRYDRVAGESVQITIVNDMSKSIAATVRELENNIISGMILVLLVLFFFMGGARNALFVAVSVPMSMLITFLVLSMLGVTLNMVVLFSLLLALGMLVDNAIVIVENIYRHASSGKDRVTAAYEGTKEVGWAVIASTATTVAAFFPMLFWPGIMGEFMGYLPLTVIITLLSSLFVALVINPTLCATLLHVKEGVSFDEDTVPDLWIYRAYRKTLEFALAHRTIVTLIALAVFIGTFVIFGAVSRGVEFFPKTTPEQFSVEVTLPDGTNIEETQRTLAGLQGPIAGAPDLVTAWITDTGTQGGGQAGGGGEAPHYGQITVELKSIEEQPSDPNLFMDELRQIFAQVPGAEIIMRTQSMGPPTGAPVSIEIAGDDLSALARLSQQVLQTVQTIPGVIDLRDNLELTRPEIHVEIDRQRAAVLGLSTHSVAQTVRTAINGTEAGVFREADEEYDILVRLPEERRASISDIQQLTVVNRDGVHIPLVEVANVVVRGGSGSIRRKDQERVVTISGDVADGYLPAVVLAEAQQRLGDMQLPAGYEIRYTGESQDQQEAAEFLGRALLAAVFLILLILVTQFNSIAQPFIIMFTVFLSLIGVLWSLIVTQAPFGIIMTGIGIISLAGVVVNNAIVLIDYINQLRARGWDRREALIQAGLVRFRPVMLTAITTILGLLPIVLGVSIDFIDQSVTFGGASVEMWGPMGVAVTGGLLVATVLTLVVVPVLYSMFDSLSDVSRRIFNRVAAAGLILSVLMLVVPAIASAQGAPATPADETSAGEELFPQVDDPTTIERRSLDDAELESAVEIAVGRALSLQEARELVRTNAFDVQLAQNQVDSAQTVIRQAYSALFPNFSASGNYTVNQEEVVLDFGDGLPAGIEVPPSVVQPKTNYNWNLVASMRVNFRSWPLIRQAYAQRDLAQAQVEMTREMLDQAAVQTYFNLVMVRRMIDISVQQALSAQTILRFTEAQVSAGTATEFELTRARLRVVQTQKEVDRARQQFIQVRKAFAELLQTDDDFDVDVPERPTQVQGEDLLERAEENRAAFEVNRLAMEVAALGVEDIFYQYLPALSASFRYGGGKSTALMPGDPRWTLTLGAEWTLWDGGLREAQLKQARAQQVAAELRQEQTRHQIASEIDQAQADVDAAHLQLESSVTEIELAQRGVDQAETAFRYGVATQLDVINAQDQLRLAQLSRIQDELQLELAIYNLQTLVEGLHQ
ncbi:hypothetical protein DL240_16645 [Lujinxingia litoralis]|uniref:Acriflavin resistance protein n=1 Tax=Lujinxingia litoralis TaxID=2211119 RepID=A0A328C1Y3_9DELT|nr:efflux RND transporter permease subunit [Lujinxingia litoralis]RAL20433.1 hypothetical protein DL240_16645 [Lujinxingia litoralis]